MAMNGDAQVKVVSLESKKRRIHDDTNNDDKPPVFLSTLLKLRVCNEIVWVYRDTFANSNSPRFRRIADGEMQPGHVMPDGAIFIDENPLIFHNILHLLRTGKLAEPPLYRVGRRVLLDRLVAYGLAVQEDPKAAATAASTSTSTSTTATPTGDWSVWKEAELFNTRQLDALRGAFYTFMGGEYASTKRKLRDLLQYDTTDMYVNLLVGAVITHKMTTQQKRTMARSARECKPGRYEQRQKFIMIDNARYISLPKMAVSSKYVVLPPLCADFDEMMKNDFDEFHAFIAQAFLDVVHNVCPFLKKAGVLVEVYCGIESQGGIAVTWGWLHGDEQGYALLKRWGYRFNFIRGPNHIDTD